MTTHGDARRYTSTTWPWPVGAWVLPLFWLVVLLLASLSWWLS
jgi:hypothetical protein